MKSLFNKFVEQQIRTINDYATNIENIFYLQYTNKNTNINLFNFQIKNEKNNAMENIKKEKNKLKSKFGFFPMETIYDLRIEQLFNKILNKVISIYSSINQTHINNFINQDNYDYNLSNINSRYLFKNNKSNFTENNDIENDLQMNKINISKSTKLNDYKFLFSKVGLGEDLNFLDFWKNKFETEIMNVKKNELNVNKTINLRNINNDIIKKNEKEINIMPANDFFKNVKLRKINRINNNKKESNGMKLPDIYSYGQLFAFSGIDGINCHNDDFAGMLMPQKITIRFDFENPVFLSIPYIEKMKLLLLFSTLHKSSYLPETSSE